MFSFLLTNECVCNCVITTLHCVITMVYHMIAVGQPIGDFKRSEQDTMNWCLQSYQKS